jgi:hypothetical protein
MEELAGVRVVRFGVAYCLQQLLLSGLRFPRPAFEFPQVEGLGMRAPRRRQVEQVR